MKLLAFTDVHGDISTLERLEKRGEEEDIDCFICAGDITFFGEELDSVLERMNKMKRTVILIHGNHEDREVIEEKCSSKENIKFIHNRMLEMNSFKFIGLGGGGFYGGTDDPRLDERIDKLKMKFGPEIDDHTVIVSHAPPGDTLVDEVRDNYHVGNNSLKELVEGKQPLLVICGHLHETFYKEDQVGETPILNPGPEGTVLNID